MQKTSQKLFGKWSRDKIKKTMQLEPTRNVTENMFLLLQTSQEFILRDFLDLETRKQSLDIVRLAYYVHFPLVFPPTALVKDYPFHALNKIHECWKHWVLIDRYPVVPVIETLCLGNFIADLDDFATEQMLDCIETGNALKVTGLPKEIELEILKVLHGEHLVQFLYVYDEDLPIRKSFE